MANYFEKKEVERKAHGKYYRQKPNLRLKYAALASIAISIMLLLILAFGSVDRNNTDLISVMRGCAGLFAIVFAVLVGILVYRVNSAYLNDKFDRNNS